MKVLPLLMVLMMVSTCLAVPRRAVLIGGIYGQQQRYRAQKGKTIEGKSMEKMSHVMFPERTISNHHSIPRQHYNYRSGAGTSPGDDPDNNESETAQP